MLSLPMVTLVHIIQVELEGKGLSVSVVVVHPTIPTKRCARGHVAKSGVQ
jgi:hypothetical protein